MIATPLQYFGIGDNIFTVGLMNKFIEAGYKIVYPVLGQNVQGLQRVYPHIEWVDYKTMPIDYERKEDYELNGVRYLPIRFADQMLNKPYKDCMRAKYDLYGFDWHDWRVLYKRNIPREYEIKNLLNVPKEYNLVSRYFGSTSQFKADIKIDNGLPVIEMRTLTGYSLFDWSWLIENATYIHAASSSILYMLELLDLKAKEVHLYARKPIEPHFDNVRELFTKPYVLHV